MPAIQYNIGGTFSKKTLLSIPVINRLEEAAVRLYIQPLSTIARVLRYNLHNSYDKSSSLFEANSKALRELDSHLSECKSLYKTKFGKPYHPPPCPAFKVNTKKERNKYASKHRDEMLAQRREVEAAKKQLKSVYERVKS